MSGGQGEKQTQSWDFLVLCVTAIEAFPESDLLGAFKANLGQILSTMPAIPGTCHQGRSNTWSPPGNGLLFQIKISEYLV